MTQVNTNFFKRWVFNFCIFGFSEPEELQGEVELTRLHFWVDRFMGTKMWMPLVRMRADLERIGRYEISALAH